jgi:ATP-dependent RNA helicase RhlE
MQFADLRLAEPIQRALAQEGYSTATPIQAKSIPHALSGRDVLGCAQTGTGKTAAFALPILQKLGVENPTAQGARSVIRALVLCPTRELATQIADSFRAYGRFVPAVRTCVIFGGVGQNPQVDALRRGVDVVIATPGRLLDLMNQGFVDLRHVNVFVLDEADRMLDMGFIADIRRIIPKLPPKKQTMLFSATMPPEIKQLADSLLRDPAEVAVAPVSSTAERVDQSVYFVDKGQKPDLLAHLFEELPIARGIVFTRTKHGADRVVKQLKVRGITAEAIHGNKTQNARQRALDNFKRGRTPLLVATDIASRGIDVDDVSHVVNYDLTHEPETYVHRIGRTARAGASGFAVSFCDADERENLVAIQKLINREIPIAADHPYVSAAASVPLKSPTGRTNSGQQNRQGGPGNAQNSHNPFKRRPQGPSGFAGSDRQRQPNRGSFANAGNADAQRPSSGNGQSAQHAPRPAAQPQRQPSTPSNGQGNRPPAARPSSGGRPQHPSSGGHGQARPQRPSHGGQQRHPNAPRPSASASLDAMMGVARPPHPAQGTHAARGSHAPQGGQRPSRPHGPQGNHGGQGQPRQGGWRKPARKQRAAW